MTGSRNTNLRSWRRQLEKERNTKALGEIPGLKSLLIRLSSKKPIIEKGRTKDSNTSQEKYKPNKELDSINVHISGTTVLDKQRSRFNHYFYLQLFDEEKFPDNNEQQSTTSDQSHVREGIKNKPGNAACNPPEKVPGRGNE